MGRNTGTASCVCAALENLPKQASAWSAEVNRDATPHDIPEGRRERRRETLLLIGGLVKWGTIIYGTVYLYRIASEYALAQRGYEAIGGEALLLLLPVIYYIVERMVEDTVRDIKTAIQSRAARASQSKKRQKKTAPRLLSQNKREAEFAGNIVHKTV